MKRLSISTKARPGIGFILQDFLSYYKNCQRWVDLFEKEPQMVKHGAAAFYQRDAQPAQCAFHACAMIKSLTQEIEAV
jgi:hypothetical protein